MAVRSVAQASAAQLTRRTKLKHGRSSLRTGRARERPGPQPEAVSRPGRMHAVTPQAILRFRRYGNWFVSTRAVTCTYRWFDARFNSRTSAASLHTCPCERQQLVRRHKNSLHGNVYAHRIACLQVSFRQPALWASTDFCSRCTIAELAAAPALSALCKSQVFTKCPTARLSMYAFTPFCRGLALNGRPDYDQQHFELHRSSCRYLAQAELHAFYIGSQSPHKKP